MYSVTSAYHKVMIFVVVFFSFQTLLLPFLLCERLAEGRSWLPVSIEITSQCWSIRKQMCWFIGRVVV